MVLTVVGAYNESIAKDATNVIRAKGGTKHAAAQFDSAIYGAALRETRQFILAVVEDTWVRLLKDVDYFYTRLTPKQLLNHLNKHATGKHASDILRLRHDMEKYHLQEEGIPEYIALLKQAQEQAKRAGKRHAISDDTLVVIASDAMMSTGRFPRTDELWEELEEDAQDWDTWCTMYTTAYSRAQTKRRAAGGRDEFGSAHVASVAGRQAVEAPLRNVDEDEAVLDREAMDGYMDNIAAAATNQKELLEQLVENNTKLAASNEELVATNKKLTNECRQLREENNSLRRGGQAGARTARPSGPMKMCPNCKRMVRHEPDDCFELEKNAHKRYPGWKSCL